MVCLLVHLTHESHWPHRSHDLELRQNLVRRDRQPPAVLELHQHSPGQDLLGAERLGPGRGGVQLQVGLGAGANALLRAQVPDAGRDVRQLNRNLRRLGYDAGGHVFTPKTKTALEKLQRRRSAVTSPAGRGSP